MEGEMWKNEFSGSSTTNVIPYSDNQLDKLSPEVWRDVKIRVATLLDDSVPHSFKKSIAQQLCNLFESLEHRSSTTIYDRQHDNLAVVATIHSGDEAEMGVQCSVDRYNGGGGSGNHDEDDANQINRATHELNHRLRSKIAEFNEGLAHLGTKILKLKTRLLTWNTRPAGAEADCALDIETCRNVNRNFRRILQKESRYLRDQLYAATETIQRLEKRPPPALGNNNNNLQLLDACCDTNMKCVPYYELKCRPMDFINIESGGAPQLWLMSPVKSLPAVAAAAGCLTTTTPATATTSLVPSRSALMKRSAPPLEVVAGPDVKSGKFICSFGGTANNSSPPSLVEWNPNQIEQLSTDVSSSSSNTQHDYQSEDKQQQHQLIVT